MFKRILIIVLFLSAGVVEAQWVSRQYTLTPGWNAIYLPFQPAPSACSDVFEGLPVETVAWWCREPDGVEYETDMDDPFLRSVHWRKWVPEQPESTTFSSLLAGESYLINLATNVSVSVTMTGTAVILPANWIHDEYNLTGFPIPSAGSITFEDFFSFTDKIGIDYGDGGDIWKVLSSGAVQAIFRPQLVAMIPGKAYWVLCGTQATEFAGPIRVALGNASQQMNFSDSMQPQVLKVINESAASREITIRHVASETPPSDIGAVPLAGKTPLLMGQMNWNPSHLGEEFVALPDTLVTNVAAGSIFTLKLMPDIPQLSGGIEGTAFQSILEVSDENNEQTGAVVVQRVGVVCNTPDADFFNPAGLWVGTVAVDQVSRAPAMTGSSNEWDSTLPVAVSRAYEFQVLMHVDATGTVRMIQRVFPAWIPDGSITYTKDGASTNGIYELFTDAEYADQCKLDHPEASISCIQSANFPLMDPVEMSGAFGSTSLICTVSIPFDDPVNPFVHPYHPQHDNQEVSNGQTVALGAGPESFDVSRAISLQFDATDVLRSGNPDWGISTYGGTFNEEVSGLNKTIYVRGTFRIEKVNECDELSFLEQE